MDIVQRAIDKKQHISKKEHLNLQTWREFHTVVKSKKLFLFGAGSCADSFLEHCKEIRPEGIIDNDTRKQNYPMDVFIGEARGKDYGKLIVSSIDLLKQYDPDDIVVLITSTNYYEQISDDLEKIGVKRYFVMLIMEADRRNRQGYDPAADKTLTHKDYAKICCGEEIEANKIVFYAFGSYADHGKYITEALLRIRKDLDIVWLVSDMNVQVPNGVRKVYKGNWKRYIYELETAGVWIYNMVIPDYIIKRRGQTYIQTKHWASVTLKRFYLDSATIQDVPEHVSKWKYNGEIIDHIITGSDFDTESCRRGFGFEKEVWQIGSPRSDALFYQTECKEKVYGLYHIEKEIRTLVYAPTYRFDRSSEKHMHESRGIDLDFEGVKRTLEMRFGGEWYIILRLHPSVKRERVNLDAYNYVINASDYEDSEELVSACDIMISDYSSIMFEPAFVNKPVFLFAMDRRDYIDKEYDLLIDYDTLPFPIAESNMELLQKIEQFDQSEYEKALDVFMRRYGVHEDGHASERAAVLISELIADKGKK